ncbi:MAG TPA: carboxypeptidase regulatory-like domain-containing protein [Vicinamibacterales bacterium]|nr:carboxypeptidase regulatory-like domain-containing protein [Vicinamibacterales bacterium]
MTSALIRKLALLVILMLVPCVAMAQGLGAASMAGVVKDPSGAVLPGVIVEAASSVLIEKVRTTVTDAEGRYQLAELRPGAYTLTFTLTGFTTYKREGLQLRPSFAATINADLKVGELNETIVVSGQSPLVDTRSVSKVQVISQETLAALPTSKSVGGMLAFVPGAVSPANGVDTGGTKGEQSVRISVFGARPGDMRQMTNGLLYTNLNGDGGGRLYFVNPVTIQENVIDLGAAGSALYQTSGAVVNTIPREGGNRLSGTMFGAYTNHNLQNSNLSDDLKAWGLTVVNGIRAIGDVNGLIGGPIANDRWWFVVSGRYSGSTLRAASLFHDANLDDWVYTPDNGRPVDPQERNRNVQARTTFQFGSKDKFGASTDIQRHFRDQAFGQLDQGTARVEANAAMCHNDSLTQFTWSRAQSNTLLYEGGGSVSLNTFGTANFGVKLDGSDYEACGQSEPFRVNIADAARGANYHGVGAVGIGVSNLFAGRFAMSYVTGAHNFKTGFNIIRGNVTGNTINRADDVRGLPISYTFTNNVPTSMTLFADRNSDAHMDHDLALYAQDQWTLQRLTLNLGLRFDWIAQSLGAVDHPANALFPAYSSPALERTPNWKDLSPRIGAAYDLFGNGRTAIKGGINRYVAGASTGVASLYGPTANFSTTRNWTDANGNYLPDCDLNNPAQQDRRGAGGDVCGVYNTPSVGTFVPSTSVIDPSFTQGWFKRGYNWRATASVEQQIANGLAVAATYAHAIYGNFIATDNQNLTPADFDPYCITLPTDPRLARSGQQLCGLWDQRVNVATSNLIGFADNYVDRYAIGGLAQGHQKEHFDGFDLQFNSRYRGGTAGGGWSVGNTIQNTAISANGGQINNSIDQCFVVDNPEQLTSQVSPCDVKNPYQHRFRFNGSYELPWGGVQLAAVYQDLPGPLIVANRTYTSAEINAQTTGALGRNLRLATRTINMLEPFSKFGDRVRQVDLRVSKLFRFGDQRFQANLDVYNLANGSTATFIRNTYTAPGAVTATPWLQPTQVMDGRFVKFSAQFDF